MNRTTTSLLPPLLVRDAIAKLDEAVLGIEQLHLHGKVQLLRARSILAKAEQSLSTQLATKAFEEVLPKVLKARTAKVQDEGQDEDSEGNE